MMTRSAMRAAGLCGLAATLLLSGCANRPAVPMSSAFESQGGSHWPASAHLREGSYVAGACHIRLAGIQDLRTDPQVMGDIGGRMIHATDTVGWVRSGLEGLKQDPRIRLDDQASTDASDLVLDVDLVKAYVLSITTEKTANVVLRVRYSRAGASAGEKVYRGVDLGANWVSGADETQSTFDRALTQLLEELDTDVIAHCAA